MFHTLSIKVFDPETKERLQSNNLLKIEPITLETYSFDRPKNSCPVPFLKDN